VIGLEFVSNMPTIDELAPATAASDTDELPVSQGGVARKVTRAQLLAGVQPQLALGSGTLVGRSSAGTGGSEQISIGANLALANGTLAADAAPFVIASMPGGTVPITSDLVPLGQSGNNSAVTYGQFMSGLPGVSNVDASQLLVTPTGEVSAIKLADFAADTLPLTGGTLTGALALAADPTGVMQAATKNYVDGQAAAALPKSGGTLVGPLVLAADPTTSLQAATKQYVDGQVGTALPKTGGTISGSLTLPFDPAASLQAATKQYVDARLLRSGDSLTGALTLAANPTTSLQAATKGYVDSQVASALPKSGGSLTGALTLAANPAAGMQAATKQYVDGQVATALPLSGGTLKGMVTLATDPTSPLHAATKEYVDAVGNSTGVINVKSPPYGALINGITDDTAAFIAAYQAAPAGSAIYVPNGVTVIQNPNYWSIPLTKRVKWIVDGTCLSDGTSLANAIPGGGGPACNFLPGTVVGNSLQSAEVSQTHSQPSDFSVSHSSYVVDHSGGPAGGAVITNARVDTIIYSDPNNYVWGGLDRLLWCGTESPVVGMAAQHVGRYVQTVRQNEVGTDSTGRPLPQPQLWVACLEYRDTTGRPSSWTNASLTIEMDWVGNGPDDANVRQIQSLVVAQNDTTGAPVEISTVIGVYLAGGCTGHVYRVFNVNVPFSTAVLDTSAAQQMAGAAAIRLAAGHAIAFESTNTCSLAYDSGTNTLRWNQGALSYVVGKGITVGWLNTYSANATLACFQSGNIIFLVGSSASYTIALPAASTVAAGTGYTFSALGAAAVNIAVCGTDIIDNGPITLRQNDRYHVVSDGSSTWREVFRTNAVNPCFSGPPVLPSYSVASLPITPGAGAKAFARDGRKPSEGAHAGSGVEVFYDGVRWISVCSGSQVQS
jgi:hypothetical protein